MPTININLDEVSLHAEGVQQEIKDLGAVMSHVYYGRGFPVPDEGIIANVVKTFRIARREWGTVYLVWDEEDTGFGGEDSELERIFDAPIEDDTHALLAWYETYGFASGEEAEPLRRKIAELAEVDYRQLTECQ
jgi:hypothetical protein